jgi:ATP-dependent Zn protease
MRTATASYPGCRREAEEEMKAFLQQADERAESYLTERRPMLDRLAELLLEREELEGSELERLLEKAGSAAEPVHH